MQITTFDMKPPHGKTKDGKPSGFPLRPRRLGVPSWSPENKSFRGFFVDVFLCAKHINSFICARVKSPHIGDGHPSSTRKCMEILTMGILSPSG